jgi:hypothetical protein
LSRFDTAETDKVAELLQSAGFGVSSAACHTAKNPDLHVTGRERFWAEVKALADTPQIKSFDLAHEYFACRLKTISCAVDLYVSEQAKHREYKLLLDLITKSSTNDKLPAFALLSDAYNSQAAHRYELQFASGNRTKIIAYLNKELRIVAPWQLENPTFGQTFDFKSGGNNERRQLRSYADEFLIGAHLYQMDGHRGLVGTTHAKGMWQSTSQKRLRRDVAKANQQFSASCKSEDLPGVVFLVGYASVQTFVSALLGDTMVAVPTHNGEAELAYYGRNGVLKRHQNTHISATYLLSRDNIYFLANPFARQPIKNFLPDALVIYINDKGEVIIP